MADLFKKRYKSFRVGPLPASSINRALGTELDPADVWVSKAAHRHIAEDHPDDYALVKANIIDIITSPTYVGQDPKHGGNFYLVRRVGGNDEVPVLIAIGLEMTAHGTYSIRTAYSISEDDVNARRLRGSLHFLHLR